MEQVVTVIVYNAKGLKPKKKGKHKFSVKFGVGSNKYTTDAVEDLFNNPSWNTESDIQVSDPALPLKFTVLQKDEVLGQVIIPMADLPKFQRHRRIKADLQPHKKCSDPSGELFYEAWISHSPSPDSLSLRSDGSHKKALSGLKKLKSKIGKSPVLGRKKRDSRDGVSYGLANRSSLSMHDLSVGSGMFTVVGGSTNSLNSDPGDVDERKKKSMSVFDLNQANAIPADEEDESMKPEINGVSPRESPVEGGAKITIRGENLGLRKEDIIGLYICGSNCLLSVEYISSHKLICTTKPWKACTGNIVIETQSGGTAVSLVEFAFVAKPPKEELQKPPSPVLSTSVSSDTSHISGSDDVVDAKPPPAKPPRRVKASSDSPMSDSPDNRRKSLPPGAFTNSPAHSPVEIAKRRSVTPDIKNLDPHSPFLERKPPASPKQQAQQKPEAPAAPQISITSVKEEHNQTSNDDKISPLSSSDTSRPVAEIKPQLTSSNQRKRQAPAPPALLDSRSQSNSPIPSESPNMELINGVANSRFYDISFVDEIHSDKDEDVSVVTEEVVEPPVVYFDREKRESDKRRSVDRELDPIAELKKTPVIQTSPGPTKREYDTLKEREQNLEIEQRRNVEELRKWKEAYQKVQQENQDFQQEVETLQRDISVKTENIHDFQEKEEALRQEVTQLQLIKEENLRLNEALKVQEEHMKGTKDLKDEVEFLQIFQLENKALKEEIERLNECLKESHSLKDGNEQLNKMAKEYESFKEEVELLRQDKQLGEDFEDKEFYVTENKTLKQEIESLKIVMKEKSDLEENQSLKEQKRLIDDDAGLKDADDEDAAAETLHGYLEENARLISELEDMQLKNKDMEQRVSYLEKQAKESENIKKEAQKVAVENEAFKKDFENLKDDLRKCEGENGALKTEVQMLQKTAQENKDLLREVESLKTSVQENHEYRIQKEALVNKNLELQHQNEALHKSVNENKSLKDENEFLLIYKYENKDLKEEIARLLKIVEESMGFKEEAEMLRGKRSDVVSHEKCSAEKQQLQQEIDSLQTYVNQIVTKAMTLCPEVLQN